MSFRAIIYNIDKSINNLWLKDTGNWFDFENRSYRIDRHAIAQLTEKDGVIRSITESVYIEGNPCPLRSKLTPQEVTTQNYQEQYSYSSNHVKRGLMEIIKALVGR